MLKSLKPSSQPRTKRLDDMSLSGRQRLEMSRTFDLRVNHVIDMASVLTTEQILHSNEAIDELINDLHNKNMRVSSPSMSKFNELFKGYHVDFDQDEFAQDLYSAGLFDYLVCFAKPADDDGEWCKTKSRWFYAKTIDDAWQMAIEWVKSSQEALV